MNVSPSTTTLMVSSCENSVGEVLSTPSSFPTTWLALTCARKGGGVLHPVALLQQSATGCMTLGSHRMHVHYLRAWVCLMEYCYI